MTASIKFALRRSLAVGVGALAFSVSGCGDSTGPETVDVNAALQSLALGMGNYGGDPGSVVIFTGGSFEGMDQFVQHATINVAGSARQVFALVFRETYPAGTCMETLYIFPGYTPPAGECTAPPPFINSILWETHSAHSPPDRMLIISADEGTSNFDFYSGLTSQGSEFPASAIYIEGHDKAWISSGGTLVTQITATNQSCYLALPPYASSGTCTIANFAEHGSIDFQDITSFTPAPTSTLRIDIPQQTIQGLVQAITETKPYVLPASPFARLAPGR